MKVREESLEAHEAMMKKSIGYDSKDLEILAQAKPLNDNSHSAGPVTVVMNKRASWDSSITADMLPPGTLIRDENGALWEIGKAWSSQGEEITPDKT